MERKGLTWKESSSDTKLWLVGGIIVYAVGFYWRLKTNDNTVLMAGIFLVSASYTSAVYDELKARLGEGEQSVKQSEKIDATEG